MASLERAYGVRGAVIALSLAAIAGGVHGVMAASFDYLALKIAVGIAGAVVLIMAGAISARQSVWGAVCIGLSMGAVFFLVKDISKWSVPLPHTSPYSLS